MERYLDYHAWKIIENGFHPEQQQNSESIFSIGNGQMGQRANFEEQYSGPSLQGSYVGGIYYPDKTRVGWWKNGYPPYFAKVLNAVNWIGIGVEVDGVALDLHHQPTEQFYRELNLQEGTLTRSFEVLFDEGKRLQVNATRFCSMAAPELGVIRYAVTPVNFNGKLRLTPYLDFDVRNADANYGEKFWEPIGLEVSEEDGWVHSRTRKTGFEVCAAMQYRLTKKGEPVRVTPNLVLEDQEDYVAHQLEVDLVLGEAVVLEKYAGVTCSRNHDTAKLVDAARKVAADGCNQGFNALLKAHKAVWAQKWEMGDIAIEGDVAAQQGIRYNIFQLHQTYTGDDPLLNIGPKGFTGEKYGGCTYWDTEAYCLPFYLSTCPPDVARNLLVYRYKHLEKAIENAANLGFSGGAALYPMVTMNGEESHNEWEITFEEIHRNGAIAHAIFRYVDYTGDVDYLADYGAEVLVAISRFWRQRINFSASKNQYVMLGVTGPNEYENNVNNNWYTNTIACWTLEYTMAVLDRLRQERPEALKALVAKVSLAEERETEEWQDIIENMYYPHLEGTRVFLQQEGYMDKEQSLVKDLDQAERPLNQHWSWDRILRSPYIKQADVLQGIYFLEDRYDLDTIRENFDFYEPRTVHESSLSPCVHVVLAARLGEVEQAHQLYLRTARLDLDDYNQEAAEGLHITSMAGTWMAVVEGFGGMRVRKGHLSFNPVLPAKWKGFSFQVLFGEACIQVRVTPDAVTVANTAEHAVNLTIWDQEITLAAQGEETVSRIQAQTV